MEEIQQHGQTEDLVMDEHSPNTPPGREQALQHGAHESGASRPGPSRNSRTETGGTSVSDLILC